MKINPVYGTSQPLNNSQPLRNCQPLSNSQPLRKDTVSFKMAPVRVPPQHTERAKSLVKILKDAIEDCDTGLFQLTSRKAARDKVPVEIVKAAMEQAQSGKQLLIYA